jgi:hypothetical protein
VYTTIFYLADFEIARILKISLDINGEREHAMQDI